MKVNELLILVIFGGGLVAGSLALVHLWRTPSEHWRQLGVSLLIRLILTVLLIPLFGLITMIVAGLYWLILGRRVATAQAPRTRRER